MGGKQKHSQRTKGNTRPSSSGRSAERLLATGGDASDLTGYRGILQLQTDHLGLCKSKASTSEEVDSSVDGDFRMLMKKMTKKDVVTRLKALQEFRALCMTCDERALNALLPFWPRFFNRLCMDFDRRVREATHAANTELVRRVKRNLAPHLKQLIGNWLLSLCDSYGPAATSARNAFEAAFTAAKQANALVFCKDEILALITDNLLHQTPKTLVDSESAANEDVEATYSRIISSSMLALSFFTDQIPSDELEKLAQNYSDLVKDGKFWKFSKHQVPLIRNAWFSLIATICRVMPTILLDHMGKLCPAVLGNLDESDPTVVSSLWEAALHVAVAFNDCWQHVNMQKAVLPKLRSALRKGFQGNAFVVGPYQLPFLSKLSNCIEGKLESFYEDFFTNFRHGMALPMVQSECSALVKSYLECIRFAILETSKSDPVLAKNLTFSQLLPLVESSLMETSPRLSVTCLHRLTGDFLHHVYLHSATSEPVQGIGQVFWDSLSETCIQLIDEVDDDDDDESVALIQAVRLHNVCSLFAAFVLEDSSRPSSGKTSQRRVAFADEDGDEKPPAEKSNAASIDWMRCRSNRKSDSTLASDSQSPLMRLAVRLYATAKRQYATRKCSCHLRFLSELLTILASDAFLGDICESNCSEDSNESIASTFFDQVLKTWLLEFGSPKQEDVDSMARLVLCVLRNCVGDEERLNVLMQLGEAGGIRVMEAVMKPWVAGLQTTALENGHLFARWLRTESLGIALAKSAERVFGGPGKAEMALEDEEKKAIWCVLTTCLTAAHDGLFVVVSAYVNQILSSLLCALPSTIEHSYKDWCEPVCHLMIEVFTRVPGCWQNPTCCKILMEFFKLGAGLPATQVEQEDWGHSGSSGIEKVWLIGVDSLVRQQGALLTNGQFLAEACNHLHHLLIQVHSSKDIPVRKNAEDLKRIAVKLLCGVAGSLKAKNVIEDHASDEVPRSAGDPVLLELLKDLLPTEEEWNWLETKLGGRLMMGDMLRGKSYHRGCVFPEWDEAPRVSTYDDDVISLRVSLFVLGLLKEAPNVLFGDDAGDVEMPSLSDEDTARHILGALNVATYCKLAEGFVKNLDEEIEGQSRDVWGEELETSLLEIIGAGSSGKILERLVDGAANEELEGATALLWSCSLRNWIAPESQQTRSSNVHWLEGLMDFERVLQCENGTNVLRAAVSQNDIMRSKTLAFILEHLEQIHEESLWQEYDISAYFSVLASCLFTWTEEAKLESAVHRTMDVLRRCRDVGNILLGSNAVTTFDDWNVVRNTIEAAKLMDVIVDRHPEILTSPQWDLVLCSIGTWVEICYDNRNALLSSRATTSSPKIMPFACIVIRLVAQVASTLCRMEGTEPLKCSEVARNLQTEWREFFAESIYSLVLRLFVTIASGSMESAEPPRKKPGHVLLFLLEAVSMSLFWIPVEVIRNNDIELQLELPSRKSHYPIPLQTVLHAFCPLLLSPIRDVQLGAYTVLSKVVSILPSYDEEDQGSVASSTRREEESEVPNTDLIDDTSGLPGVFLTTVIEASVAIDEAAVDTLPVTYGYLLSWNLMLGLFVNTAVERRSRYALYLREKELIYPLADSLFNLMPGVNWRHGVTLEKSFRSLFVDPVKLDPQGVSCLSEVKHLACTVYFELLRRLPALVREWWNGLDRRTASDVEKYTAANVSPLLCSEDIRAVQMADKKFDNMNVKTRPVAREVVAKYKVGEVSFELVVRLAENHPLGAITVETGRRIGVSESQWSYWILQLTSVLMHQNGSILDGLLLWKRNADKKFEGVEECYICFSVLQTSTCQLPRLACRTCKKKFHSSCLYKWFSTSGHSTCPICRSIF